MNRRAIRAEVTNGQFRFQESVADLEGRRVWLVVLDEDDSPTEELPRLQPSPFIDENIAVEQDVNFERPFRRRILKATVRDGGRLPPTLILPEEDANE